jgi:hypothetical protein
VAANWRTRRLVAVGPALPGEGSRKSPDRHWRRH